MIEPEGPDVDLAGLDLAELRHSTNPVLLAAIERALDTVESEEDSVAGFNSSV